ncbi:hypothetical protein JCM10908_006971 [Rhodotorula pacifica]|uniref:uncharacterized protein n=1 Tax=Rhodotorula pacifica TaxID=1495444 RepID=UPI00317DB9D2
MVVAHHPALSDLVPLRDFEPLRVASHTDMTAAVQFSLEKLASTSNRPIVLHTLPPPSSPSEPSTSSASTSKAPPISQKQVDSAVDALPKLVSILEIIKREFPACSTSTSTSAGEIGKPSKQGRLHQYTRLTTFETALEYQPVPDGVRVEEDAELEAVRQELVQLEWLTGRAGKAKRPRKRHSPCMLVVLSRQPLSALANSPHFTYQKSTIPQSKKRPRPADETAYTATGATSAAVPLTSTPLPPAQAASTKNSTAAPQPPRPDPSQPSAVAQPSSLTGSEPVETQKKRKPNRRRIRRKKEKEGRETAGAGAAKEVGGAAEAGPAGERDGAEERLPASIARRRDGHLRQNPQPNLLTPPPAPSNLLTKLRARIDRSDLNSLEMQWRDLLGNVEDYPEPDRLNSLYHLAPQLAKLWASATAQLQLQEGESLEAYDARLRGVYEEEMRKVKEARRALKAMSKLAGGREEQEQQDVVAQHDLEAEARLALKKLKRLECLLPSLREASGADKRAYVALDRRAYENGGPAWALER